MNDHPTVQENATQDQDQPPPTPEIQPSEIRLPSPAKMPMPTGGTIKAVVPQSIEDIWRIAMLAAKSGMIQKGGSPESAAIAIMHGLEIGIPPMMALQRIAVINGRPSLWGDAVPAVAMSTGQLLEWSEHIQGKDDGMEAVCRVSRKTALGIFVKEATFSVADARQAGLWDEREKIKRRAKDGTFYDTDNDSPWHCYPKRMLTMRARVAFRDLFADAMCGMYIAEELIGEVPAVASSSFERVHRPLGDDDDVSPSSDRPGLTGNGAAGPIKATGPAATNANVAKEQQATGAHKKAAGAKKEAPVPDSAETAKASPETSGEAGAAFKPAEAKPDAQTAIPWVRKTGADYVEWAASWMTTAADAEEVNKRYTAERKIRNDLGTPLDEKELAELMRLKETTIDRCRTLQQART